ncbi:unnamed protein product, partial [Timema podura]|nr:unnamed protein product [Timema podura]
QHFAHLYGPMILIEDKKGESLKGSQRHQSRLPKVDFRRRTFSAHHERQEPDPEELEIVASTETLRQAFRNNPYQKPVSESTISSTSTVRNSPYQKVQYLQLPVATRIRKYNIFNFNCPKQPISESTISSTSTVRKSPYHKIQYLQLQLFVTARIRNSYQKVQYLQLSTVRNSPYQKVQYLQLSTVRNSPYQKVQYLQLSTVRNSPYQKYHERYNPNLIDDDNQELSNQLEMRHRRSLRITHVAASSLADPAVSPDLGDRRVHSGQTRVLADILTYKRVDK